MSDVVNNRIVGVSDIEKVIPVAWGISATELYWHNAVIMGTVIARKIDKANLWDGTLNFKESVPKIKMNNLNMKMQIVSDDLTFGQPYMHNFIISENITKHTMNTINMNSQIITDNLPKTPVSATNNGYTIIYVHMYNPIFSTNVSANLSAFEITALFGGTVYTLSPTSIELSGINTIKLTVDSLETATGNINVLYKSELGNLTSNIDNSLINSFNISFLKQ